MKDICDKLHVMMEVCDLKCTPENEKPQAVNYIVQQFDDREIRIPVCQKCEDTLNSNEDRWVLLYCLNCLSSQWIDKKNSNKLYHYATCGKIKWMEKCHKCYTT